MWQDVARTRRGFSLIEIVVVMLIMGVIAGLTIPKLTLSGYRVDAVALQVRSALQIAQRTALARQYDMIVSFDTAKSRIRIVPDLDNSGTINADDEIRLSVWRPLGASEGNDFLIPPKSFTLRTLRTPVYGSTLKRINSLPSIVFHRDGSASSEAEIYVANTARGRPQYRLVTLVRSTGRTDAYRYAGTGVTGAWEVIR